MKGVSYNTTMTENTQLTLYTEGFTSGPEEVNLIAHGAEIHPQEMAYTVEYLFDSFNEFGSEVGMIEFLSNEALSMKESGVGINNPHTEYIITFIPEEMQQWDEIEFGRRDNSSDWEFRTISEWKDY